MAYPENPSGTRRGDDRKGTKKPRSTEVGPAPSAASLHESALAYLARSAATAAGVTRALERRIATWTRKAARAGRDPESVQADAERSREAIGPIVARLREVGLVNDAAFAAQRARSLSRAGRSRRAIAAHLTAKGAASEIVREALPTSATDELGAALTFARKRRVGPFAREAMDRDTERKALAAMARAGFDYRVAERALRMDLEQAEERLSEHRRL